MFQITLNKHGQMTGSLPHCLAIWSDQAIPCFQLDIPSMRSSPWQLHSWLCQPRLKSQARSPHVPMLKHFISGFGEQCSLPQVIPDLATHNQRKNTEVPLEAFCNSSVAKCIFWHLETQPSAGKVCLLPTL